MISVWNNGRGIPVEMHAKEKMYVPELIFGTLLTSSNYNDDQKKVTGGRNGYGAKLCNIFSTEFTVETACSESGKLFKQVSLSLSVYNRQLICMACHSILCTTLHPYMYIPRACTSHLHARTHNSYLTVIGVHEMHGRMHPNYRQITILLVVNLCSSLAYFMMTHPLPKLPIKTLVARQLPTNTLVLTVDMEGQHGQGWQDDYQRQQV